MGWKFLESPGIETDGIDNDLDGLTDERRDNDAGTIVFGPVGKYGDPKEHWSRDEDGDWLERVDDVGADGIMELDEGYPVPILTEPRKKAIALIEALTRNFLTLMLSQIQKETRSSKYSLPSSI
jgi:hypothetical protein